jgi:hypothetical protein
MTWRPKPRVRRPWRDYLTREETTTLASIDKRLASIREEARELSVERIRIQNRATVRAGK